MNKDISDSIVYDAQAARVEIRILLQHELTDRARRRVLLISDHVNQILTLARAAQE